MTITFTPTVGTVLSADIAVPDHERELRFYSRILSTGERPLWREDLMNNLGLPVIGLGERAPEYEALPLQWMPHIQVTDVAAAAHLALEMGGRVLMHHKDDEGQSQWAVLQDPNGAAFGVIPVIPPEMIPPMDPSADTSQAGRIAWLDLTVPDAAATRDFYRQVVGWATQDVAIVDEGETYTDYNMLGGDGNPAAGVCHTRGGNADLPPVWMLYLPVGDLNESLSRVVEEGGKVVKAVQMEDGQYVFAVIQDPVGVYLALMME